MDEPEIAHPLRPGMTPTNDTLTASSWKNNDRSQEYRGYAGAHITAAVFVKSIVVVDGSGTPAPIGLTRCRRRRCPSPSA